MVTEYYYHSNRVLLPWQQSIITMVTEYYYNGNRVLLPW